MVKLKPLGGLLQTGSRAISEQVVAATFPMLLFSATAMNPGATPSWSWQRTSVVGVVVGEVGSSGGSGRYW